MCSTESRADADLPLGRSALASHACTHLILGPHGSFDGSTRNEQPSACGYSCPHDPIAGGPAHPHKQALWTHHEALVGLRITSRQRQCCSHARDTSHRNSVASHHPRGNSLTVTLGLDHEGSVAPHTRHYTRSVCSTSFLFRCSAPDQVCCSRSGAPPARRRPQATTVLLPCHTRGSSLTVTLGLDREGSVAPPTPHYTRSVCSTPLLFGCNAPHQVCCSRTGAVPARRHRQAAEALCASVLESARAQASAGARDRSALNPFDRTARPRRHLPNARKASRQSLQPGYETPPPSG